MAPIEKVIIIGAGPAGISAALHLKARNQLSSVVYELRSESTSNLGGALGIPSNGLRLLDRMGLYEPLAARGAHTRRLVLHSSNVEVVGDMDLVGWSEKQTGFGYMRIKRTDVMEVLLNAAAKEDIQIQYSKRLERIEEKDDQVTVYFADGTTDTGDMVLGCDGIHSAVRTYYVDPNRVPAYTGIANVGSIIPTADLPSSASELEDLHATFTEDGLVAVIPATAAHDSLYWFFSRQVPIPDQGDTRDGWEEREKSEVESMKATLIGLLGDTQNDWIDLLRRVVNQTEVVKFFPVFQLPSEGTWSRGRVLLLGDAAHAMPPHASQGFSMALEDVFLLSKILHSNDGTVENMLKALEPRRRPRVEEMLQAARSRRSGRGKTPAWRLRFNELALMGGLKAYHFLGLDKLGLGQKILAYDVEKETV